MPKKLLFILLSMIITLLTPVFADTEVFTSAEEQKFIDEYSLKYHLPPSFIRDSLASAAFLQSTYNTQVAIANAPPHAKTKPWSKYKQQFINPLVIKRGKNFMCQHQDALSEAEEKYGVPASIILGIIGVETSYGGFTGNFRVLDTLSTLAFNSPRRIDFWRDELAQYLLMCYQYKLDPNDLRGAIDGGFGLGQFMPSAYLNYAVSSRESRAPNLMQADDAIMSVANYMKEHGWKTGQVVFLNARRSKATCKTLNCEKKELSYPVKTWQKNGVQITNPPRGDTMADLITLSDDYNPQAYLALNNFYTIYSYNHSRKYVMAVYLLGITVAAQAAKSGC